MLEPLTEIEARIVGSLVEKQLTTPEYYPLTLNGLTAACNQKSNRDPVMSLTETEIVSAIDSLRDKNLVYLFYGSGSRTVKYKHMLPSVYDLDEAGVAIVAVLLLRGPQTIGELRERTGRLHEFAGTAEVHETLESLMNRDEPVVSQLERMPGQKEPRYAHLLSGEIVHEFVAANRDRPAPAVASDRVSQLEEELQTLRAEFDELKAKFEQFRTQFD